MLSCVTNQGDMLSTRVHIYNCLYVYVTRYRMLYLCILDRVIIWAN